MRVPGGCAPTSGRAAAGCPRPPAGAVQGRPPAQHQQQVHGRAADGDVALVVPVLPLDARRVAPDQPLAGRAQTRFGGVEVQRLAVAAQPGQGGEVVDPRKDPEQVQQVADAVGGQVGGDGDGPAHRQLGVEAVDEGVVGDPAQPEPRRLVVGPAPHAGPRAGLADRVGQPAGAGQQPARPFLGVIRHLEVVGLVVGNGSGGPPLNDHGRPSVPEADVRGELGQRPRRAGRHRPCRVGALHRRGEGGRLGLQLGVVAVVPEVGIAGARYSRESWSPGVGWGRRGRAGAWAWSSRAARGRPGTATARPRGPPRARPACGRGSGTGASGPWSCRRRTAGAPRRPPRATVGAEPERQQAVLTAGQEHHRELQALGGVRVSSDTLSALGSQVSTSSPRASSARNRSRSSPQRSARGASSSSASSASSPAADAARRAASEPPPRSPARAAGDPGSRRPRTRARTAGRSPRRSWSASGTASRPAPGPRPAAPTGRRCDRARPHPRTTGRGRRRRRPGPSPATGTRRSPAAGRSTGPRTRPRPARWPPGGW